MTTKVKAAAFSLPVMLVGCLLSASSALAAPKGGGGGGGNADQVGDNIADLLSKNVLPVAFAAVGVIGVLAVVKSSLKFAVTAVLALLFVVAFLVTPDEMERTMTDIVKSIV